MAFVFFQVDELTLIHPQIFVQKLLAKVNQDFQLSDAAFLICWRFITELGVC